MPQKPRTVAFLLWLLPLALPSVPPAAGASSVILHWTAPGDDGHAGGPDWLGGAAAPGATESTKPSQDTGPRASAGGDGIAAPGETGTPDKVPSPRDHEVPPGRSRGGGRDETGKSAHPTAAPSGPQDAPAGTQPGGPSAP